MVPDQSPSTRMGKRGGLPQCLIRAQRYQADWDRYNQAVADANRCPGEDDGDGASAAAPADQQFPRRDLELETLAESRGDILHMHCYRADEMLTILDMAEFGYA